MWYLYFVTWISFIVQSAFITISLAAGLFYLSELVEEYASYAAIVVRWMILATTTLIIGFYLFADFDFYVCLIGFVCQVLHFMLTASFPMFSLNSPVFILAIVANIIHHWFAFRFFTSQFFEFQHLLAYFTLCAWLVPGVLLVSLSANDNTLPMYTPMTQQQFDDDSGLMSSSNGGDYVSHYINRKARSKGHSLRTLMQTAKDMLMPTQNKRYS